MVLLLGRRCAAIVAVRRSASCLAIENSRSCSRKHSDGCGAGDSTTRGVTDDGGRRPEL
jgi:hypothetical protein